MKRRQSGTGPHLVKESHERENNFPSCLIMIPIIEQGDLKLYLVKLEGGGKNKLREVERGRKRK